MQEISNKRFFINYAFFVLILVIIFGILTYSVVLSKKSWSKNLGNTVQKVLDEYEKGKWTVESNIQIDKPISVNCAAYNIVNNSDQTKAQAIIIRVTSFYGPIPAVFIYNEDKSVTFAGWSSLHGRIRLQLDSINSNKRLDYWQNKVPQILE